MMIAVEARDGWLLTDCHRPVALKVQTFISRNL